MAAIPVKPFVLKDCKLTLSTVDAAGNPLAAVGDYEGHVSGVRFNPNVQRQTWQGLTPSASYTDQSRATWDGVLAYAQDFSAATALARYLHEHEGEKLHALFEPINGGTGVEAVIILAPGTIGGDVNTFATSSVTVGVDGRPEFVDPVP